MKRVYTLLLLTLFISNLFAQDEKLDDPKKKLQDAIYYQDFVNYNSDKPGLSRIDVYIQVPYKNVQFVKTNLGFSAKYSITASVFDSTRKKVIVEKTWNETINVIDYNIAVSKENYSLTKRSFDIAPGNYVIRTMFQDKDSKQEAVGENIVAAKSFNNLISLSDVLLISKADVNAGKNGVIPNVSRNFPSSKNLVKFYLEVYLNDSTETRNTFEYVIMNSEGMSIHKEVEDRNLKPGTNQILYTMQEFPFDLGVYTLNVSLLNENGKLISTTVKSFYSHWKGLPAVIKDIDKAISQTIYIASPEELSLMKNGETVPEKTKRFLEFWKKKDPSPNNDENEVFDEYFRRIAFSNDNFSNYIEGWRSDRGMVYTILGAPNNINRHPFEYDSKPYEVWEYYDLNRSLIFLDQTGFGDYRLVTPLTGDLYRYRY